MGQNGEWQSLPVDLEIGVTNTLQIFLLGNLRFRKITQ